MLAMLLNHMHVLFDSVQYLEQGSLMVATSSLLMVAVSGRPRTQKGHPKIEIIYPKQPSNSFQIFCIRSTD